MTASDTVQDMLESCKDLTAYSIPYLFWVVDNAGYAVLQCNIGVEHFPELLRQIQSMMLGANEDAPTTLN